MMNDWCKRCGDCCKGNIVISGIEALWLVGRKIVNVGIGCPFLQRSGDNATCSVYDSRPMVCRSFGPRKVGGVDPTVRLGTIDFVAFGTCAKYLGPEVAPRFDMAKMVRDMIEQTGMVELSTDRKPDEPSVGRFKITADANGMAQLSVDTDYVGDVILEQAVMVP